MHNPFVNSTDRVGRINGAQVCPYCFAALVSPWGEHLVVKGCCPECGKRVYLYRGLYHSRQEVLLLAAVFVVIGLGCVLYGWMRGWF